MRYSIATGLVLAALSMETMASPTHLHLHKKAHAKKEYVVLVVKNFVYRS